jgi:hypothetical protein
MDARDYFEQIVKPNYYEAKDNPNDLRSVWNAILTMNTVAESIALERLNYGSVDRDTRIKRSSDIRETYPCLRDLQNCTDAMKHVRKQTRDITATSTNILPTDPLTWQIDINGRQFNLLTMLDQAFETVTNFPELTQPSSR